MQELLGGTGKGASGKNPFRPEVYQEGRILGKHTLGESVNSDATAQCSSRQTQRDLIAVTSTIA